LPRVAERRLVYKNLLFMSSEAANSRLNCSFGDGQAPMEPVSKERMRGVRHLRHR
jgi:hypothetical protein